MFALASVLQHSRKQTFIKTVRQEGKLYINTAVRWQQHTFPHTSAALTTLWPVGATAEAIIPGGNALTDNRGLVHLVAVGSADGEMTDVSGVCSDS